MRTDEQKLCEAQNQLDARLNAFWTDGQIASALQALPAHPGSDDLGYARALADTRVALSRAREEVRRLGKLQLQATSIRMSWERVAGALSGGVTEISSSKDSEATEAKTDPQREQQFAQAARVFAQEARPAMQAATAKVKAGAAQCQELTAAARTLATALLELSASGDRGPLGRVHHAEFLQLQRNLADADRRMGTLEKTINRALALIYSQHAQVMQLMVTALDAQAVDKMRALDRVLVAQRLELTPAEVQTAAEGKPLGEVAFSLLQARVQSQGLLGRQVQDCVMRVICLDLLAEREPLAHD
jgi:hypothetical protein